MLTTVNIVQQHRNQVKPTGDKGEAVELPKEGPRKQAERQGARDGKGLHACVDQGHAQGHRPLWWM